MMMMKMIGVGQSIFSKTSPWGTSSITTRASPLAGDEDTRRLSCGVGDVRQDSALYRGMHLHPPAMRGRHPYHPRFSKVFVHMNDGGGLFVEDRGFLVEWSVEAMALIRKHLHRAGNGLDDEENNDEGALISTPVAGPPQSRLPA